MSLLATSLLAIDWDDPATIGYPALGLGVLLGSIVPVVPTGAVVGAAAAIATTTDRLFLPWVILLATVAALVGDLVTFAAGRAGQRPGAAARLARADARAPRRDARAVRGARRQARRGRTADPGGPDPGAARRGRPGLPVAQAPALRRRGLPALGGRLRPARRGQRRHLRRPAHRHAAGHGPRPHRRRGLGAGRPVSAEGAARERPDGARRSGRRAGSGRLGRLRAGPATAGRVAGRLLDALVLAADGHRAGVRSALGRDLAVDRAHRAARGALHAGHRLVPAARRGAAGGVVRDPRRRHQRPRHGGDRRGGDVGRRSAREQPPGPGRGRAVLPARRPPQPRWRSGRPPNGHPVPSGRRPGLRNGAARGPRRRHADVRALAPGGQPRAHLVALRLELPDRSERLRDPARAQRRHPRLPLVREGPRPHHGLRAPRGRRRDRAPPLRRARAPGRRRRRPRQPVHRRRAARQPHHERGAAAGGQGQARHPPPRRDRGGLLRLLRQPLQRPAHAGRRRSPTSCGN